MSKEQEKKDFSENEVLVRYEIELRTIIGELRKLGSIYGIKDSDLQEHVNKVFEELKK